MNLTLHVERNWSGLSRGLYHVEWTVFLRHLDSDDSHVAQRRGNHSRKRSGTSCQLEVEVSATLSSSGRMPWDRKFSASFSLARRNRLLAVGRGTSMIWAISGRLTPP